MEKQFPDKCIMKVIANLLNILNQIQTLRGAPRDVDKLRRILKAKHREWEDTMKIEKIERLVAEIEMLRYILCTVRMNR